MVIGLSGADAVLDHGYLLGDQAGQVQDVRLLFPGLASIERVVAVRSFLAGVSSSASAVGVSGSSMLNK